MSDSAVSPEPVKTKRVRYRPEIDGPRMKVYMAHKREKNRAGFAHLTVKQWLAQIATTTTQNVVQDETQPETI